MFYKKPHDPLTHRYPRTLREVENNPYAWWEHEPRMGFNWHAAPVLKIVGVIMLVLFAAHILRYAFQ